MITIKNFLNRGTRDTIRTRVWMSFYRSLFLWKSFLRNPSTVLQIILVSQAISLGKNILQQKPTENQNGGALHSTESFVCLFGGLKRKHPLLWYTIVKYWFHYKDCIQPSWPFYCTLNNSISKVLCWLQKQWQILFRW